MSVHFQYYPQTAPHPGTCVKCGNNQDLYHLGATSFGDNILFCGRCARDLATFVGYTEKAPLESKIAELEGEVLQREAELNKVPNLVDGLINGIRSSVTDFIFAVSYSDSADKPEVVSDIRVSDSADHKASKAAAGQRKAPSKSVSE